ncbi:hypothetical protein ACSEOW_06070 [Pseudomonas aeruginosa]|nr:hypothetical protein AO887_10450 [Pseudomonas aeruginosa]
MSDFYIEDDLEGALDFDYEAAAKAGYFGIPIEDLVVGSSLRLSLVLLMVRPSLQRAVTLPLKNRVPPSQVVMKEGEHGSSYRVFGCTTPSVDSNSRSLRHA